MKRHISEPFEDEGDDGAGLTDAKVAAIKARNPFFDDPRPPSGEMQEKELIWEIGHELLFRSNHLGCPLKRVPYKKP
jgi:hypothetical protein